MPEARVGHGTVLAFVRERGEALLAEEEAPAEAMRKMRRRYRTACSLRTHLNSLRLFVAAATGGPAPGGLRLTDKERRECKAAQRSATTERQKRVERVPDADAAIARCATALADPATGLYELALCLLATTGRRTTELLNGRSSFAAVKGRPYVAVFRGQLKTSRPTPYRIPLLVPCAVVRRAMGRLRAMQGEGIGSLDNRQVSRKYQSGLGAHLAKHEVLSRFGTVHRLRAFYACACYEVFDFGSAHQRYAVSRVLGHAGLGQADKYTLYRVSTKLELGRFEVD